MGIKAIHNFKFSKNERNKRNDGIAKKLDLGYNSLK